jgi:MoaA/NifB/PqqE/SkfB family radical SAM enzyme
MERPTGVMSRPLFERIVGLAAAAGVRALNLNNIGEPLLDPHLAWRVRLAKRAGLAVSLHTNGQLLDERRAHDLVQAGIDHVGVSLDGASPATYAGIRLGLDFARVVRNLDGLLALRRDGRPYVSVTLVRQEQNAGDVAALHARYGGRADDVVIRDARDWAGAVTFTRPPSTAEARSRDLADDLPRFPCKLLWARMVVLHDGRVALCSIDHEARHVVGDLRTHAIAEVWNGPAMAAVRRSHLDGRFDGAALCGRCRVRESWW